MLSLKPIPEKEAEGEILALYQSIKDTFGLNSVPLVFQYMAAFPPYFTYIWKQSKKNLSDLHFGKQAKEIRQFAFVAINQIYTPGKAMRLFLGDLRESPEVIELNKFVESALVTTSSLYLLSLAIRESVKGTYLGLKQIGERIPEKDKDIFTGLSEGFFDDNQTQPPQEKGGDVRIRKSTTGIIPQVKMGITRSLFAEFFKFMDIEMKELIKREDYLVRRVELERFALSLLPFIPHPLESSFATIIKQTQDYPHFPELVYLVVELFPTGAPFKLLANSVMKKALEFNTTQEKSQSPSPILLPPSNNH